MKHLEIETWIIKYIFHVIVYGIHSRANNYELYGNARHDEVNWFSFLPSITAKCYLRYHIVFQQNVCVHQVYTQPPTLSQSVHVSWPAPWSGLSRKRKVHLKRIQGAQGGCYESVRTSKAASFSRFHGFSKVSGVIRGSEEIQPTAGQWSKTTYFLKGAKEADTNWQSSTTLGAKQPWKNALAPLTLQLCFCQGERTQSRTGGGR